jgi:hypothetical protein
VTHTSEGACSNASAFGTCDGDILEVDCLCANSHGVCDCMKNGTNLGEVSYDCTTCAAVGDSWTACGFPPLMSN